MLVDFYRLSCLLRQLAVIVVQGDHEGNSGGRYYVHYERSL